MALSSGTRQLLGEVLGWVFVAAIGAFALLHYDNLKQAAGHMLGSAGAPAESLANSGVAEPRPALRGPRDRQSFLDHPPRSIFAPNP